MKIIKFLRLLKKRILFSYFYVHNNCFNKIVKKQNKNYKEIPIIIINYNQFKNLKKLISFLKDKEYLNLIIIDNSSTYPPLLEYYKKLKDVAVERNSENEGHMVFWSNKKYFNKYGKGYYAVTDPDVLPEEKCPEDFLYYFKKKLNSNINVTKVGFSLKIDDIPDYNLNKSKVIRWESKFWEEKDFEGDYVADIDTTFALYRPKISFTKNNFYKAIRAKEPYSAKHLGWYIDKNNLTEEEKYYFKTASSSSSWRIDSKGNLLEKHYD